MSTNTTLVMYAAIAIAALGAITATTQVTYADNGIGNNLDRIGDGDPEDGNNVLGNSYTKEDPKDDDKGIGNDNQRDDTNQGIGNGCCHRRH